MKTVLLLSIFFISLPSNASIIDDLMSSKLPKGVKATSARGSLCTTEQEKIEFKKFLKSDTLYVNGENWRTPVKYCKNHNFIHPKHMKKIKGYTRYTDDGTGSVYDCKKYRKSKATNALLNQFKDELIQFGDNLQSAEDYKCFFSMYRKMANKKAFLDDDGKVVERYIRLWTVASLGSLFIKNYPKLVTFGFFNSRKRGMKDIREWFGDLGDLVLADSKHVRKKKGRKYAPTNMQISRSLALLASSMMSFKNDQLEESRIIFAEAISHITDHDPVKKSNRSGDTKGYLVSELRRDRRAQSYHAISLGTLLSIRAFANATKCDYSVRDKGGVDVSSERIAYLFRKTAEGGAYYNLRTRKEEERDPLVFTNQIIQLIEATEKGKISIPYFDYNKMSDHIQTNPNNVDSLADILLLSTRDEESLAMIKDINKYLKKRGHAPLQPEQPYNGSFKSKLGGQVRNYPPPKSLYKISKVILNDKDKKNDFMALVTPKFCSLRF